MAQTLNTQQQFKTQQLKPQQNKLWKKALSIEPHNKPNSQVNIDTLLRDTVITVLQLRAGTAIQDGSMLYQTAKRQVEALQAKLRAAQYSEETIQQISYAQCALLDETVMNQQQQNLDDKTYQTWVGVPLQIHFFNTLEAGEALYERIKTALTLSATDPLVLACFHRILLLGFVGKYGVNQQHPERIAIIEQLNQIMQTIQQSPNQQNQSLFLGTSPQRVRILTIRQKWWCGLSALALAVLCLWHLLDNALAVQIDQLISNKSINARQYPVAEQVKASNILQPILDSLSKQVLPGNKSRLKSDID